MMIDRADSDSTLPGCPWVKADAEFCEQCGLEIITHCQQCENPTGIYHVHTRTESDSGEFLLWGYTLGAAGVEQAQGLIENAERFDQLPNTELVRCEAHHEADFESMFFTWTDAFSPLGFMNGKHQEFSDQLFWQLSDAGFKVKRMPNHSQCFEQILDGTRIIWDYHNQPDVMQNDLNPAVFFEESYFAAMLDGFAPKGAYLIP